jgi:hypothetical protein
VLGVTLAVSSPALALIGGQVDALDRFPAVVAIAFPGGGQPAANQCTATKIGPVAFLTAAHCVVDHTTARAVMDDADPVTLTLIHGVGANAVNIPVRLRQTLLPPAYEAALGRFRDYKAARLRELGGGVPEEGSGEGGTGREPASGADPALGGARRRAPALAQRIRLRHHFSARFPDVAVLIVAEPTPAIPTLAVDLSPLAAGAEVELVGRGCRQVEDALVRNPAVRTWGVSTVLRVDAVNFYSAAAQLRPGAPSLCPGDSGGPVLRDGRVVGVHGVVYGLKPRAGARSNLAVNLSRLADWPAWALVGAPLGVPASASPNAATGVCSDRRST